MKKLNNNNDGFSLVELMVVVAIIGILAALAVPRFQTFQVKARQSEAKTNLSHIYGLEVSYQGEWDTYVDVGATCDDGAGGSNCPQNDIGFMPSPCKKSRYQYSVSGANISKFEGTASSGTGDNNKVNPGCLTADSWKINEEKALTMIFDSSRCKPPEDR